MGSAAKILLADDEQTFLHSTADLLRDQGYDCDCAMDAEEASAPREERRAPEQRAQGRGPERSLDGGL